MAEPMPDLSYMCNALIPGREAIAPLRIFTAAAGNWIRGTVTLKDDRLVFATNKIFAIHQDDSSELAIPYGEITACRLGRLALFLKTVDVETPRRTVRFRCLIAWNETLLAELQKRMQRA